MMIKKKTYKTKKNRESIISRVTATNEPLPEDTGLRMKDSYGLWPLYEMEQNYARSFLKWAGVPDDLSDDFSEWCQSTIDAGGAVSQAGYGLFAEEKYPDIPGITTASDMLLELFMFNLSYKSGKMDIAIVHILRASNASRTLVLLRHEDDIRARRESTEAAWREKREIRKEYIAEVEKLLGNDAGKLLRTGPLIKEISSRYASGKLPSKKTQRVWIGEFRKSNPEYDYIATRGAPRTPA